MSREIKFRAWDRHVGKMFDWIELKKLFNWNVFDQRVIYLMQFTGFYDINGNEVYEGDLLAWPEYHDNSDNDYMPVIFEFGCFTVDGSAIWDYAVYIKDNHGKIKDPTNELEELMITGNIYEDPDLVTSYYKKKLKKQGYL